ncbi:MAG TPA: hypothetical protein VFC67_15350 [Prolixibacteraceae bacterium]|nr:hypothetical protein [Prolixibacteraceae bacterium]
MKLTIAGNQIALTEGTVISIERSTPFLNDDTGSFSFPFPVPTLPNQQVLGWPGNLERSGDIPDQSFILEESGMQVFRGEVDYDEVTAEEIGIILKSGYTEFTKKMEGKKLADFDYGRENWPSGYIVEVASPSMYDKLKEWDLSNTTDNGKYVVAPFWIDGYNINGQDWGGAGPTYIDNSDAGSLPEWGAGAFRGFGSYCLQFRVAFVLRKIFEGAGYVIKEDSFSSSEFNKAILYGKIIKVEIQGMSKLNIEFEPIGLQYSTLMPDVEILDFLDVLKNMFCLMYEINEQKKEVYIKFKKEIFLPENLDGMKIDELTGWVHREERALKGFSLAYSAQDNELDTEFEYVVTATGTVAPPAPTKEGDVYHRSDFSRDYSAVKNDSNALEWKEIGRLRERFEGDRENTIEMNVKVPAQKTNVIHSITLECPFLSGITIATGTTTDYLIPIPLTISLYHGRKKFGGQVDFPYTSFDQFSLDGTIDTGMSLKPAYLYDKVYSEFLNWQTYRARGFTKYIQLSILQLLALQWGKRYMINGAIVILDKINYDLPYTGTVEVSGFSV